MINDFFEISQRVFPAGKDIVFTIRGRYEQQNLSILAQEGKLRMCIIADSGMFADGNIMRRGKYKECRIRLDGDVLIVEYEAQNEGEYYLSLELVKEDAAGNESITAVAAFDIYVLEDDLFKLRPLKGDMHVHTSFSQCGSKTDSPEYVCATARAKGLDYISVTDHIQIEGSESVADFSARFNSSFAVYSGEECHVLSEKLESRFCRNIFLRPVHIVNFGGNDGVCRYANEHYDEFHAQVSEKAEKIELPYDFETRYLMAASDWICDKIHEFGGLAIFCHPFWRANHMCNMPHAIGQYILQQGKFDMMEVVGLGLPADDPRQRGMTESINLALAWWQDASIRQARNIPVVGNTDTHNAANVLGSKYTIVFAAENTYSGIYEAFKKGLSVAVMNVDGIAPQVYGQFRLVHYAHFLLRNFYPGHDELCAAEGRMMQAVLRGEFKEESIAGLEFCNASDKYTEQFFGK